MSVYDYCQNKEPVCPWCGFKVEELFECGAATNDGETANIICEKCDKEYSCQTHLTYSYTTKGNDCKMHTLKLESDFGTGKHYYCVDCKWDYYDWQLPGGKHPALKDGEFKFLEETK